MRLDPIASQEGSFRDAQPARTAAGITEGEMCGFLRSSHAQRLRAGADRARSPCCRANHSSRALSLKLKTAFARGRVVPS